MHRTEDGANPTGQEQQIIWLMNRARSNPRAEGEFLAKSGDPDIEFANRYFKVNLTKLRAEFAALPPAPPATFDRRLYAASRDHSLDLIRRNAQDHNGQLDRVRRSGFAFSSLEMSVYAYSTTAVQTHGALNIDWGFGPDGMQPGRGHRQAIMGSSSVGPSTNVGIALVPDNNPRNELGPLVFSGVYVTALEGGNHFNRFIVGTVWDDRDGDGMYDPGEGLGGVRLQPDRGSWHAVTGDAGGFSIPVTEPGTYRIHLSGGQLPSPVVHTVTVGAESVLLDIEFEPQTMLPPPLPLEVDISIVRPGFIELSWQGGMSPWQVQRASSPEGPWENAGDPVQVPNFSLPVVPGAQFFRVIQE